MKSIPSAQCGATEEIGEAWTAKTAYFEDSDPPSGIHSKTCGDNTTVSRRGKENVQYQKYRVCNLNICLLCFYHRIKLHLKENTRDLKMWTSSLAV